VLKVINISKSFSGQEIFDSVSFNVNKGERIGLVGRNGHGKTTLMRIITGEEHADDGEISIPRGYHVGYVQQHLKFTMPTVVDEGAQGLPEYMKEERWRVEKILSGLGFSAEDMKRSPAEFSGGFQVRLNLAKVLVSEPDLLLLDEPTNYLDVISIRWLASFLRQWKNELMLITHDRSFMDSVVTHIVGIHRKKIRKIAGATDKYYEQILREEEIHEKTRVNDEKKRKETELFITRFRAKARLAGMVQSRVKALERMETLDRLEKIKSLDFSFAEKPTPAKAVMHVKDLSFGYDKSNPLLKDLSFSIGRNDRICVIGKNGKGKTTLLRMLSGELTPDTGEILAHPATSTAYYAQTNSINLNMNLTVEEEIMAAGCERQQARNICGAVMFEGDDALKKISVLSGGEKARVLLGKILATPSNLLFLDEPTNHLDMESCDAFLAAIDSFDGAVVMVTHNEMFLHALANRFIVFQGGGATVFEGTYQRFLEKVGWEEEEESGKGGDMKEAGVPSAEPVNKKDLRRKRADILTRRSRETRPLEDRIAAVEKDIEASEKNVGLMNNEIIEASGSGASDRIGKISIELHAARKRIESLYDELDALTRDLDSKNAAFDQELSALGGTD
jgi:ATP-binding cassette subfamily F protein 3